MPYRQLSSQIFHGFIKWFSLKLNWFNVRMDGRQRHDSRVKIGLDTWWMPTHFHKILLNLLDGFWEKKPHSDGRTDDRWPRHAVSSTGNKWKETLVKKNNWHFISKTYFNASVQEPDPLNIHRTHPIPLANQGVLRSITGQNSVRIDRPCISCIMHYWSIVVTGFLKIVFRLA